MPHVRKTDLHAYDGRRAEIQTVPIPGLTAAELSAVDLVVDGGVSVSASFVDDPDGLVVSAVLSELDTAQLGRGRHWWQLLPTLTNGDQPDPLAEGFLDVTQPATPV